MVTIKTEVPVGMVDAFQANSARQHRNGEASSSATQISKDGSPSANDSNGQLQQAPQSWIQHYDKELNDLEQKKIEGGDASMPYCIQDYNTQAAILAKQRSHNNDGVELNAAPLRPHPNGFMVISADLAQRPGHQQQWQENEYNQTYQTCGSPYERPQQQPAVVLNDYQSQLMLLEQQNKKRLMMARQEQDAAAAATARASPQATAVALNDCQLQLMLLEQQNKKRLMMARQEQDVAAAATAHDSQQATAARPLDQLSGPSNRSVQDYQMHLILLDQQKKKRELMAAQQLPPPTRPFEHTSGGNYALQDYEMQLMLLEQQNKKKRIMMAQRKRKQEMVAQSQNGPALVIRGGPPPQKEEQDQEMDLYSAN